MGNRLKSSRAPRLLLKAASLVVLFSFTLQPIVSFAQTATVSSDQTASTNTTSPTTPAPSTTNTRTTNTTPTTPTATPAATTPTTTTPPAPATTPTTTTPPATTGTTPTPATTPAQTTPAAATPSTSATPDTTIPAAQPLLQPSGAPGDGVESVDLARKSIDPKFYSATDPVTGSLSYTYPVTIPPGRNNLQPNADLSYTSQPSSDTNIMGYGWDTKIPYIERINKMGTDSLYAQNYFYSSLDGELYETATTSATSTWGARVENGAFNQYQMAGASSTAYWIMTDKNGTTYTFGTTTASRLDNPSDGTQIYKWELEKVQDTNGNYITYQYSKDEGEIYPSKITYTNASSTPGIFEIDYATSTRSDIATSSTMGFPVVSEFLINDIKVKVNGTVTHDFALAYTAGENGMRSILSSITESGYENGATTTLPAVQFTYTNSNTNKNWTQSSNYAAPVTFSPAVTLADVNGDGLIDMIHSETGTSSVTYLNNGSNAWVASSTWTSPVTFWDGSTDFGARVVDVNGDGLPDIVQSFYSATTSATTTGVYINNGNGWTASSTWSVPVAISSDTVNDLGIRFVDLNGDGLPDIVQSYEGTRRVYMNNGHGWTYDPNWIVPVDFVTTSGDNYVRIEDVNGDGLPDLVQANGLTSQNNVWINNGKGWTLDPQWTVPVEFSTIYNSSNWTDTGVRFMDINGDGLPDLVQSWASISGAPGGGANFAWINTGHGWASDPQWATDARFATDNTDNETRFADVNGDGMIDIIYSSPGNTPATWINNASTPDLLSRVTFADGGSANYTYTPSQLYRNGGNLASPNLPISLDTVSGIGLDNGLGVVASTTYSYQNGKYYYGGPYNRQFAGFQKVIKTDAAGNVTNTYYHQGNAVSDTSHGEYQDAQPKIGKVYRTESYDNASNLYAKSIFKWDMNALSGGREFVDQLQEVDSTYDGTANHTDKATSYTYDMTNGNVLSTTNWGQVNGSDNGTFTDTGSDAYTASTTYATSSSSSIALPDDKITTSQSGTKVNEEQYYYDGNTTLGTISLGNLTKEADWISGTSSPTYASTTSAYNSLGLVTSKTDALGHATTFGYDSYNLYVATTTNPLSQKTYTTYDYPSGKVATSTDPNGSISANVYDGLGRLLLQYQPDTSGTSTAPVLATQYQYTDTAFPIITQTTYLSSATTTETFAYLDGFGRISQSRFGLPASYTVTPISSVNYLIVGSGGGGGSGFYQSQGGGGGGEGGTVQTGSITLGGGVRYIVTVGTSVANNVNGNFSSVFGIKALGGVAGNSAGTGGGTGGTGNSGANGGNGATNAYSPGQNGSNGTTSSISGSATTYGGGGGGGGGNATHEPGGSGGSGGGGLGGTNSVGYAGATNTGGGGGGAGAILNGQYLGGVSGSGIVIIAYPTVYSSIFTCGGSLVTVGTSTICTYNSNGGFLVAPNTTITTIQGNGGGDYSTKDYQYNNLGLLSSESLPYFSNGPLKTSSTTNTNLYTNYSYDPIQRVKTVTNAVGSTQYAYNNWTTTITDPDSHLKDLGYDAYGNLIKVTEHNGISASTTQYVYDGNNNLTKLTDALGNVRNFTYDGLGRELTSQDLHATTTSSFGTWTYTYDAAGNKLSVVDPKSNTIQYTYDALNRVLTESLSGSGTQKSYTYDSCTYGIGQLCSVGTASATTTYAYDPLGHTTSEKETISGSSPYTTQYSYDRQGNVLTQTYPDSSVVTYFYNSLGQLNQIYDLEPGATTTTPIIEDIEYGPDGQVTYQRDGNSVETFNTYNQNALYRLTARKTVGPGTGHLYSPMDNLLAKLPKSLSQGLNLALASQKNPIELPSARTPYTKLYFLGKGTSGGLMYRMEIHTKPQFIESTSTGLISIDSNTQIVDTASTVNLTEGGYSAQIQNTPLSNLFTYAGPGGSMTVAFADSKASVQDPKEATTTQGALFTYSNALGTGANLEVLAADTYLQKNVVLTALPANTSSSTNYSVTFKLSAANGTSPLDLKIDGKLLSVAKTITSSDEAEIISPNGVVSYIWPPEATDAAPGPTPTHRTALSVTYQLKSDGIYVTKNIPYSWLSTAVYPVRADLTFSGFSGNGDGSVQTQPYPGDWYTQQEDVVGRNASYSDPYLYADSGAYNSYNEDFLGITRAFLPFDTSALPYNAVISSSTMEIYPVDVYNEFPDSYANMNVYQGYEASSTAVINSDISKCGDAITNPTKGSTDTALSAIPSGTYTGFTLNSTGLGWINAGGYTNLCMREGHDTTNNPVINSGNNWEYSGLTIASSRYSSTTDPYLAIVYTVPDTAPATSTALQAEDQTDPFDVTDTQPHFSAMYNDASPGNYAVDYEIQIATSTGGFSSPFWDSGELSLSPNVAPGSQSQDLSYTGTALALDHTTYYYRIRFWDAASNPSPWSSGTDYFTMADDGTHIQSFHYTYDPAGNITGILDDVNGSEQSTFTYDSLNRLLTASSTVSGFQLPYYRAYSYDALGNIASSTEKGVYYYQGNTIGYVDPDAVTSIVNNGATTSYSYDKNGNLTYDGGLSYLWNYLNQLTSAGNTGVATSTYSYDYQGNRVKTVDTNGTTFYPNKYFSIVASSSPTITKNIFANGVLVASIGATGTTSVATSTPTLNATTTSISVGSFGTTTKSWLHTVSFGMNRLLVLAADILQSVAGTGTVSSATYGGVPLTKISSIGNSGVSCEMWYLLNPPSGSNTMSVTVNGSTTALKLGLSDYTGVSQLMPIDAQTTATGTYGNPVIVGSARFKNDVVVDDLNRLSTTLATTSRTALYNDHASSTLAANSYQITVGAGSPSDVYTGTVTDNWCMGITSFAPATTTSTTGTTTTLAYVHQDQLGGTNATTDRNGLLTENLQYYPYGNLRTDTLTSTYAGNKRKYIGQQYDPQTTLDYLNARYYADTRGGFISEDPLNLSLRASGFLADPQNLNFYAYANGNPISGKDPSGKLVELISRPVTDTGSDTSGQNIGIHVFYLVTPNDPDSINFPGVAAGTQTFTVGGYPTGPVWNPGNLQGKIGTVDSPTSDIFYAYGAGQSQIINHKVLTPPNGESDTQFINSLGVQYGQIANQGTGYAILGKNTTSNTSYGNSNNFAYTLGTGAGVQSQLNSFKPGQGSNLLAPGYGYTLNIPGSSIVQQLESIISGLKNLIKSL